MRKIQTRNSSNTLAVVVNVALLVLAVVFLGLLQRSLPARAGNKVVPLQVTTFHYACHADNPKSLPCLQQHYQVVTQTKGAAAAFTELKTAYAKDPTVVADCHQLTHTIGRTVADASKTVAEAYSQGDNFCWSGYYHGVMESIIIKIGATNLIARLPTICAELKAQKPYSFYHYNCVHGIGHGIMDVEASDLFASLKTCDALTDNWEQQSCYGGVFMENEMDEVNPNHHTAYLNSQPMYPCTAIADKYKTQCYLMQTSHALRLANEDFLTVFNECAAVETAYRDTCYQSLGRDASGNSSSNAEQTRTTCMLGANLEGRQNCIIGAVKDFISYFHSDTQAEQLCQSLDPSLQPICETTKTEYYATF